MPDGRNGDSGNGDADSKRGLWTAIRNFFDDEGETSLRAQIEEAIAEHEDEQANGDEQPASGDLSPVELTMLRNLLHFSEHDADDVAIPRGEIIAVGADATWDELVAQFAEHGHSRMPVYRDTLDHVIGMIHIKDVFPFLATGKPPPPDWTTLMRQPLYVPQARGALDVLADIRARRIHLAIVVDEVSAASPSSWPSRSPRSARCCAIRAAGASRSPAVTIPTSPACGYIAPTPSWPKRRPDAVRSRALSPRRRLSPLDTSSLFLNSDRP